MKKFFGKRLIACIVTVIVTCLTVNMCARITERKESRLKYAGFFEHKKDIDVLFVGTSHVVNGIQPLDIYEKYGITSYNLGTHGVQQAVQYWTLANALGYVTPKVVIIDCYSIDDGVKVYDEAYNWVHAALDAFPISINKIRAAIDITSDIDKETGSAFDIVFNFNTYHNRWSELEKEDFDTDAYANRMMGASMKMAFELCEEQEYDPNVYLPTETGNMRYLKKMIDLCKSRGIRVILTFLPCKPDKTNFAAANTATQIANESNIEYINLMKLKPVNYATDFSDDAHHLNPLGAKKVSCYFGEYLTENHFVDDKRKNPLFDYWAEMINEYSNDKTGNLTETDDVLLYLMLLQTCDYKVNIYWNSNDIWKCKRYRELFKGMGITAESVGNNNIIEIEDSGIDTIECRYEEGVVIPEDIRIIVYTQSGNFVDMVDLDYVHANSGREEDSYCTLTHSVN